MSKIGALLLCIASLAILLPACAEKNDPFAVTGFSSLTIEKNETVRAVVSLNMADAEAHANEKAYIYELLPGEDLTALHGKVALKDAPIGTEMIFEFPLRDGEHTRLYSSFAVCYENGSLLLDSSRKIDNPEKLASCTSAFQGKYSPKGLLVSDVESAVSMGVTHAMLDVVLAELCGGSGSSYRFDGTEYTLSSSAINLLDRRVKEASDAGMQVSLRLIFDSTLTKEKSLSLLDFLTARYAGGALGTVTALFVEADGAKNAGELARLASVALVSNVKNGRVYVVCKETTVSGAEAFFLNVSKKIAEDGEIPWGAAVIPAVSNVLPWETSTNDTLDVQALSSLYETLQSYDSHPIYFALCDLRFDASDGDKQAVSLAYAYAKAIEAGTGLVYYGTQRGSNGLLNEMDEKRTSAEMFRRLDLGLDAAQIYLCQSTSLEAWETIKALKPSRTKVSGYASAGFGAGEQEPLFDFTGGSTLGFSAVGGAAEPESRPSAAWGTPVLYTWLHAAQGETGVRKLMANSSELDGASALSLQLLAQYNRAERCSITLRLVGCDTQGSTVSYESVGSFDGRKWQTVTFDISEFVANADLSQPCALTVLCEPGSDTDETFVLFLKGIYANYPQESSNMILPIVLTVAGVLIGFLLILILYRRARVIGRKRG
ncbi:MAG: hypothetical protein IJX80_00400 [Clostridia bacterium]|nr:hypothetical protein [Clostridia bacterium]